MSLKQFSRAQRSFLQNNFIFSEPNIANTNRRFRLEMKLEFWDQSLWFRGKKSFKEFPVYEVRRISLRKVLALPVRKNIKSGAIAGAGH